MNVIEVISGNIDKMFFTNKQPSWHSVMKQLKQQPELKKQVITYLNKEIADLKLLHNSSKLPSDDKKQLKEAYSYLPLSKQKSIIKTVDGLIKDIEQSNFDKYIRQTKTKQKVNKFEVYPYRQSWYDIKSIDIKNIILYKVLVVYETSTKTLYFYRTPYLFDITTTSLNNVDKEKSFALKLRTHVKLNTLKQIANGNIDTIKSLYNEAVKKGKNVKVRFNENMLILFGSKYDILKEA